MKGEHVCFLFQGEKTRRGKCKMYHNVLVGLPGKETETNIFAIKLQR